MEKKMAARKKKKVATMVTKMRKKEPILFEIADETEKFVLFDLFFSPHSCFDAYHPNKYKYLILECF
jgi:hypothetical protein